MKTMHEGVARTYREVLRRVRARGGDPTDFFVCSLAADLALEVWELKPDKALVADLSRRLGIEEEELAT